MGRRERSKTALRLFELPLEPDPILPSGLVPRDDDVHEPLEEVALLGRARPPRRLERLVRLEEPAAAREQKPVLVVAQDGASVV